MPSPHYFTQRAAWLWGMVACASLYLGVRFFVGAVFASRMLDASLGVLLGLFICSHPAANAVDMLFFGRADWVQVTRDGAGWRWLGLNLLVLFLGWLVITLGAVRFGQP